MGFANLITGLAIIGLAHGQKYAGDSCYHNTQAKNGVCKPIGECPSAILELTTKQILPQTCSYDITVPIVCCPVDAPETTPTPTTTTTTTTTPLPEIIEKAPMGVGAKSFQKCREYAKSVYVTKEKPTLSGISKNVTDNVCAIKHVKLIVGGVKAKGKEFPHMVAIGYDSEKGRLYICGGSLISHRYILTAGHCLSTRDYGPAKYARVGDLNLEDENDDADPQEQDIVERIPHPEYRPPSQYNDIALLKVEKDFRFTPYVRPICLNYDNNLPDQRAMATGWGTTRHLGSTSSDLLKVTLDFFTHEQCKNSYEVNRRKLARGIEDDTQVCAGSKDDEQKDTCQGDSGGPLQIFHDTVYCMYKLVGVTSFGKACGLVKTPGVYSRVSQFLPWIENTVWP